MVIKRLHLQPAHKDRENFVKNEISISENKSGQYYFHYPDMKIAHHWAQWTQWQTEKIDAIMGLRLPDYSMSEPVY